MRNLERNVPNNERARQTRALRTNSSCRTTSHLATNVSKSESASKRTTSSGRVQSGVSSSCSTVSRSQSSASTTFELYDSVGPAKVLKKAAVAAQCAAASCLVTSPRFKLVMSRAPFAPLSQDGPVGTVSVSGSTGTVNLLTLRDEFCNHGHSSQSALVLQIAN